MKHSQVSRYLGDISAAKIVCMSENEIARRLSMNADDYAWFTEHGANGIYQRGEELIVIGLYAAVGEDVPPAQFVIRDEEGVKLYDSVLRHSGQTG